MLTYVIVELVRGAAQQDWAAVLRSLGLGLWLPLSTLPLVYILSVLMLQGSALVHISWADDERLPWWRCLGYIVGAGGRRRRLQRWTHQDYRRVAKASTFVAALRAARLGGRTPAADHKEDAP
jgi:hypothetical protein